MCTVTLSYDGNNALAQQELKALLSSGRFMQISPSDELDFSDEADDAVLTKQQESILAKAKALTKDEIRHLEQKDYLSIEELQLLLFRDVDDIYKDP